MVDFMHQFGQNIMASYLVKHWFRCCCEHVLQVYLYLQLVDFKQRKLQVKDKPHSIN